jgi:flagellin-like protein
MTNEKAVSPVVGVILMVAITVILVAILASVVITVTGNISHSKNIQITVDRTSNFETVGKCVGGPDFNSLHSIIWSVNGNVTAIQLNPELNEPVLLSGDPGVLDITATGTFNDGIKQVLLNKRIR